MPIESYGVKVMSLGFLMDADQPVIWRGPMVMKAVEQFLQDVAWGPLDFLVIDLPPGTGDAQLTLTQKIQPLRRGDRDDAAGRLADRRPQGAGDVPARSTSRCSASSRTCRYYVCPQCGHRDEIFKHGGGRKTAEQLRVPFLGEIPIDPRVAIGGDSGGRSSRASRSRR